MCLLHLLRFAWLTIDNITLTRGMAEKKERKRKEERGKRKEEEEEEDEEIEGRENQSR